MSDNNNIKPSVRVQLFITCIMDTLYPEIGEAVVRVLERAGARVEFPSKQTCCGQPAFNAGMRQQARPIACHTIQVFEKTQGPIVVPSGSCTAMIRHGYMELFSDDTKWLERARNLAMRTYEFTEFLVDYLGVTDLGARYPGFGWERNAGYGTAEHRDALRRLGVTPHHRLTFAPIVEILRSGGS